MNDDIFILSKPMRPAPSRAGIENLDVLFGGAGRGAERTLNYIKEFNDRSERFAIRPTVVDVAPGRALALAERSGRRGVAVLGLEARVEEVALARAGESTSTPVVLQIDRAADVARAIVALAGTARTVIVYILVKRPGGDLSGLRMYLRPEHREERMVAARFLERLGSVTLPNGSDALFGEGADAEDLAREPVYRAWFAEHLTRNLPKAVAGLEPECAPFEVTTDGRTTSTLHLIEGDAFRDPVDLAESIVGDPGTPLRKGRDFVVGEFTPGGVRFTTVRLRKTDGRLAVQGAVVLDRASREEARRIFEARLRERQAPRVARTGMVATDTPAADIAGFALLLAAAASATLSLTNPVQTTD